MSDHWVVELWCCGQSETCLFDLKSSLFSSGYDVFETKKHNVASKCNKLISQDVCNSGIFVDSFCTSQTMSVREMVFLSLKTTNFSIFSLSCISQWYLTKSFIFMSLTISTCFSFVFIFVLLQCNRKKEVLKSKRIYSGVKTTVAFVHSKMLGNSDDLIHLHCVITYNSDIAFCAEAILKQH